MIEITPQLNSNIKESLYAQLYRYIKNEILCGNLNAGEKLPSIRHLAKYLNISKNTVVVAYEQLLAEGYVKSIAKSGVFVAKLQNDYGDDISKKYNDLFIISTISEKSKIKYDLRNAQTEVSSFPFSIWRRLMNHCIHSDFSELLSYGDHQGEEGLRVAISRYLYLSRGVKCNPEQIIIGAGTQQTLTILSLILKHIGNDIGFEEPGYNGAREVFLHHNYNVIPIELDLDGINISLINKSSAKIAYITPSHQFPCGMVMPVAKRLRLLQWAQDNNGYIIEDDYDGEFRYHGKPIPALQGLDKSGRVIYLGTFSKSLIPSIRISYMILPHTLTQIYASHYKIYEQPVSRVDQRLLQLFMEQGYWDKHIRRMRIIYKRKHDLLINSLNEELGDKVEVIGKEAGLHILLKVKNGMNEKELIQTALNAQIGVSPTSIYWMDKSRERSDIIFIGFGGIALEEIKESVSVLKKCWLSP